MSWGLSVQPYLCAGRVCMWAQSLGGALSGRRETVGQLAESADSGVSWIGILVPSLLFTGPVTPRDFPSSLGLRSLTCKRGEIALSTLWGFAWRLACNRAQY